MTAPTYTFAEKNKFADNEVWDEIFEAFYDSRFDNVKSVEKVTDRDRQLKGIDKIIHTEEPLAEINVDEKVRRLTYTDVALQLYANRESGYLGWATKPGKVTDYIAYAIPLQSRIYWIPFQPLFRALENYRNDWVEKYGIRESRNYDSRKNLHYNDVTLPVPARVLSDAVKEETLGSWTWEKFYCEWHFPDFALELIKPQNKKEVSYG